MSPLKKILNSFFCDNLFWFSQRLKIPKIASARPICGQVIKTLVFLSIILFLNGCSREQHQRTRTKLSIEEQSLLDKFFSYLLIHSNGVYTILGNKPITEVGIWSVQEDFEELKQLASEGGELNYSYFINRENNDHLNFYKSLPKAFKKKALLINDKEYVFDHSEILRKWDVVENIPLSSNYLIVKKENYEQFSKRVITTITIVNIKETRIVLEENYSLFRSFVGFDFDPLEVILELKLQKSVFWDRMKDVQENSEHLWGLLFGFGKQNSLYFSWKNRNRYPKSQVHLVLEEKIKGIIKNKQQPSKQWVENIKDIDHLPTFVHVPSPVVFFHRLFFVDFPIPTFISFCKNDPVVNQYKKERKKIKKLYKGKNFLSFTLKVLRDGGRKDNLNTSSLPSP